MDGGVRWRREGIVYKRIMERGCWWNKKGKWHDSFNDIYSDDQDKAAGGGSGLQEYKRMGECGLR